MKTTKSWIQQADNALKRAREVAEQTHTAVRVQRDGKIVKLMPVGGDLILREDPPRYGGKNH